MNDHLSPILVKELRQGLRGRVFEGAFLFLQVLMFSTMALALAAVGAENAEMAVGIGQGVFWFMIAIPLLLLMPMRGCNSIRAEAESQSLELIFLTRMSARRIVAGKWAALVCQSALFVCAVLPYAVLRYYLGHIDVVRDLVLIGLFLGLSALLTAFTVSVSAFPTRLARAMIFLYPLLMMHATPAIAAGWIGFHGGWGGGPLGSGAMGWKEVVAAALYGGLGLVFFLEVGAARIAPPAENHVLVRRSLGVAVWLAGWAAYGLGRDEEILFVHLALATLFCIDAFCGQPSSVPGVALPFVRWGWAGRAASWFAQPGWPSGLLYSFALLGAAMITLLWHTGPERDVLLVLATLLYALFAPAAVVLAAAPRTPRFGSLYLWLHLAFLAGSLVLVMLNELLDAELELAFAVMPGMSLLLTVADEQSARWLPIVLPLLAGVLAVLVIRLLPALATMNQCWTAAVELHRRRAALARRRQLEDDGPPLPAAGQET